MSEKLAERTSMHKISSNMVLTGIVHEEKTRATKDSPVYHSYYIRIKPQDVEAYDLKNDMRIVFVITEKTPKK